MPLKPNGAGTISLGWIKEGVDLPCEYKLKMDWDHTITTFPQGDPEGHQWREIILTGKVFIISYDHPPSEKKSSLKENYTLTQM